MLRHEPHPPSGSGRLAPTSARGTAAALHFAGATTGSSSVANFGSGGGAAASATAAHDPARLHELMALYLAIRNGINEEERAHREATSQSFLSILRPMQTMEARIAAERERERRRLAGRNGRVVAQTTMRLSDLPVDEQDRRRSLIVMEARCRAAIFRLCTLHHDHVATRERIQQLLRAEATKRYCVEKNEQTAFHSIVTAYMQTSWKPTFKCLGRCPFVKKMDCPFASRVRVAMRRELPIDAKHYEFSVVGSLDADQL